MRRTLIAGNWKMHGDRAMLATFCTDLTRAPLPSGAPEIALCPPYILIPPAITALTGHPIAIGAQDLDNRDHGPFTGQISARMLADSGCRYVIIGHSERRTHHAETSQLTAQKTVAALTAGLRPILCLGETRAQRQAGTTEQIIADQLDTVLDTLKTALTFAPAVIAYEPVWAIGSDTPATPAQAQQTHHFIRHRLKTRDETIAAGCRIIYGGSMTPQNAAPLLAQPDIDGALLGGASLSAADFLSICQTATTP